MRLRKTLRTAARTLAQVAAATLLAFLASSGVAARAASTPVVVLEIDGPIGPATSDYVHRGLAAARERSARLVVIRLDTPGGLDTAMREIVKDILASPIPVVSYVAPAGARAASAGTFILYASHMAAMAPATNLGAATPVPVGLPGAAPKAPREDDTTTKSGGEKKDGAAPAPSGDAMSAKSTNDAAAYIRSLAELRGRNADWAERAVREAASLPASDALAQKVIDIVAPDLQTLITRLDGREVSMPAGPSKLATAGAPVETIAPDWRTRFLSVVSNPTVALMLLLLGVYGIFFEFQHPGIFLPGVVGAIALLLALFAFQLLPVNYAGLALLLLGLALMIAEAFVPSFGALGIGGIVAFVAGGIMLFDRDVPGFTVPLAAIVGMAVASGGILALAGGLVMRSRRRPVASGREEMVGAAGEVVDLASDGTVWVRVHGENWRAACVAPLAVGDAVRVARMHGLRLEVERVGTSR